MSIEKGRKLLLTIKRRYGYDPREVQYQLSTGRLPTKVEWAIMKILDCNTIGEAITTVKYARESLEGNFVKVSGEWIASIKELEKKGWFYQRLPSEISSYFESKSKLKNN